MPSRFEDAWRSRQGVFEAKLGEPFTLLPMARPGDDARARLAPDPARPILTLVGIWTEEDGRTHAHGRNIADKTAHGIEASRPWVDVVWLLMGALSDGSQTVCDVRPDDVLVRQGTGQRATVMHVEPDDCGRATIKLA